MNNQTLEQRIEESSKRHVQSFVHMVSEGASYTSAWATIKSRTTLGPKALEALSYRCVAACAK
jgi:hypothetical protein